MSTHISAEREPDGENTLHISDNAVAQLYIHGWEPPAGKAYAVEYDDNGQTTQLFIPVRTRQGTAAPTHAEIRQTILDRIGERIKLGGGLGGNFLHSYQKGLDDAAEAIQDLFGSTQ